MNVDAKILHEILANQNWHNGKRILHHNPLGFIPRMQGLFNFQKSIQEIHQIKRLKKKMHMIIKIDAGQACNKFQYLFMIKRTLSANQAQKRTSLN